MNDSPLNVAARDNHNILQEIDSKTSYYGDDKNGPDDDRKLP